jgi:rubrerythrin
MNVLHQSQKIPPTQPKKRKKKNRKLASFSSYLFTCRTCGFVYSGQYSSCPKCKTKQGDLI